MTEPTGDNTFNHLDVASRLNVESACWSVLLRDVRDRPLWWQELQLVQRTATETFNFAARHAAAAPLSDSDNFAWTLHPRVTIQDLLSALISVSTWLADCIRTHQRPLYRDEWEIFVRLLYHAIALVHAEMNGPNPRVYP